jgi:hypothetical protein
LRLLSHSHHPWLLFPTLTIPGSCSPLSPSLAPVALLSPSLVPVPNSHHPWLLFLWFLANFYHSCDNSRLPLTIPGSSSRVSCPSLTFPGSYSTHNSCPTLAIPGSYSCYFGPTFTVSIFAIVVPLSLFLFYILTIYFVPLLLFKIYSWVLDQLLLIWFLFLR